MADLTQLLQAASRAGKFRVLKRKGIAAKPRIKCPIFGSVFKLLYVRSSTESTDAFSRIVAFPFLKPSLLIMAFLVVVSSLFFYL